jgi:ribosomal protein S18 acetylase RimI-like enzyme
MNAVETVHESRLPALLKQLLAAPGTSGASPEQVRSFINYLSVGRIRTIGRQVRRGKLLSGAWLALLLPGRVAMVMLPSCHRRGLEAADQRAAVAAGVAALSDQDLYFAQALLENEDTYQQRLLEEFGFHRLTTLRYMQRACAWPPWDWPKTSGVEWIAYEQASREEFGRTLMATYVESSDCPELTGIRPVEEVLASHRATGPFDPRLWELVRVEGRIAGCILLSELTFGPLLEIVYLGVVPELRGRGVGALLMRRALRHAQLRGAAELMVVFDARNSPAGRLYERFGFEQVSEREAYVRFLK